MRDVDIFDSIMEEDFSRFADFYIEKMEKWEWKHEGDFKVFLEELEKYVLSNGRLDSEDFLYDIESNPFSCKDDYNKYMESLFNMIFNYCDKYSLPCINEDIEDNLCFNEYCLLLKYNDNFYKIERISGQGTVDIISIYDGENKKYVIDYEKLINGSCLDNHIEIIEMVLDNAIDSFKSNFEEQLDVLGYDIALVKRRE